MERIFVTVRARPLSIEESKTSPWKISVNSIFLSNNPSTKFDFDRIFDGDCKTTDVYEARTKEIVAAAVGGFNGTVFAYGQTSSGKTHTMRGSVAEPGVIPCAVRDLFTSIQEDVGREFLVRMSYMEIYNEEINDLLAPEHRKLQIHESVERGIYVAGLREEIVTCPEQVLNFMEFGESHRHIGQTNMNLYSSRSHTIFRMIIESRESLEDGDVNSCDAVRVSVLNLVDLAGSERAAKTGAEGVRLKEGSHINKSLMTLGTVIKKLSEGAESQGGHVPYRDSKLTRILQPSLGGNANTAIICNITLAQIHTDETKSSLQFASRALRVKNCACVNEILTDAALLKRQRKEIEELRAKLLSSHSEHSEEEILNLRNTLLQIELEKERIFLELEEEKKDKALRERRLAEQAKKIANLSSMVLCSERNEISTNPIKNKRRVTWCPGPFLQKSDSKISTPNEEAIIRGFNEDGQDVNMPPTFEELTQESATFMDDLRNGSCTLDHDDKWDEFILPDARALLHVTSRRKIHRGRAGSIQEVINESLEMESTFEDHIFNDDAQIKAEEAGYDSLTDKSMESECEHIKNNTHSFFHQLCGSTSCDLKRSSLVESETIHVIKQLDDEISLVQMENTAMMKNLDSFLELDSERNPNLVQNFDEESMVFPSIEVSKEIHEVALQIDHSKIVVDNVLSFVRDIFQSFSIISETLQGVKSSATEDLVQFQSIICVHSKIQSYMRNKMDELELEKSKLQNQLIDHHKQIQELKSDIVNWGNSMEDQCSLHELEKNELLGQVLFLQKEVSCLSSSALLREKECMRKELDKTKQKLKETESKLKNTNQEKTKLESDKMQAEREVKRLIGQRAILERDIWKRDSLIDRRHSKLLDSSSLKGPVDIHEQTLQADYQKLGAHAFEMEAEVASLKEALTNNLNTTDLEINFLKEEIVKMEQKLGDSESHSRDLKASLDFLTREKEEMEMQIADAFLEMEVEKTTWLSKEKALMESHERLKLSDLEFTRFSNGLLEVRRELESSTEQCRILRESLLLAEENVGRGNDCSSTISSENVQLVNKGKQCEFDSNECRDTWSKLEAECHHTWEEVKKLQGQLNSVFVEWGKLSLQLKKDKNEYKNFEHKLLAMTIERDVFLSKIVELKVFLGDAKVHEDENAVNFEDKLLAMIVERDVLLSKIVELKVFLVDTKTHEDEYALLLKSARINAEEMNIKVHKEAVATNKEMTKHRMRLRSMQAKLDGFRGRYKDIAEEKKRMNRKFQEASSHYNEKLRYYGTKLLEAQRQLVNQS